MEQFALISEQCAHRKLYPTMRTLYPRLFWCRLRVGGVALNNSFRRSPHACPYYCAIISKSPKLNPAFQPPFSLSPLIFLRIFVFLPPGREKRSKKRRNGRREVEIFARICVTLAFRFFFKVLISIARGKRTVEGRLSLLLNLIGFIELLDRKNSSCCELYNDEMTMTGDS